MTWVRNADGTIVRRISGMRTPIGTTGTEALDPRTWVEPAARAGFAAQALVYGTVGVLASMYALGIGGRTTDSKGAIAELGAGSLGGILLVLMALGFAGYAIWRVVQAVADTEGKGTDVKGIAVRVGYFAAAVVNGWLAVIALKVLFGERPRTDEAAQSWTARILSMEYGVELVVAIGIGVVIYGIAQFHRAFSDEYRRHLKTGEMGTQERALARGVSKTGLTTRGIIYLLAGIFLVTAALDADPAAAHDPGGVLAEVARQPYGRYLLGALALGLLAYAGYAAFEAAYRRIRG
jgi:hypothetical protein